MSAAPQPSLFETMRSEMGQIARLGLHLDRLGDSALAFGIPFDPDRARDALATRPQEGLHRIRLVVHPDGRLEVDIAAFEGVPLRTAWVCPEPMLEAGGLLCVHKTTHRDHYATRWRAAQVLGADEAIVLNPAGEVVEGTRTSVWIEHEDGFWTPPLSSGGLPGVERAHLLATRPDAGERVLRPADLQAADAVFLSNALRGLMRVELVDGAADPSEWLATG